MIFLVTEQKFMHLSISPLSENIYEFLVFVLEISGLPKVYSNHKIQKESDNRQNGDYKQPSNFRSRVSTIENNDDYSADYKKNQHH